MLYITTRSNADAFTSHKALVESVAHDGGVYYPYKMPQYSQDELLTLKNKTFGEIISGVLNTFFGLKLNAWDVDCCLGRNILNTVSMQHRIVVAELWHNLSGQKSFLTDSLYKIAKNGTQPSNKPTEWFKIATRIAVLFAVYGELLRKEIVIPGEKFDVSVSAIDFSETICAFYAKQMGLPIGTIICSELNNSCVWDFIHRGIFNPSQCQNDIASDVERLIHGTLGYQYLDTYFEKLHAGQIFSLNDESLKLMNCGLFCSVIGEARLASTISSIFSTNNYVVNPKTAMLFCGLQDFRAKTGESRITLLIAEESPQPV